MDYLTTVVQISQIVANLTRTQNELANKLGPGPRDTLVHQVEMARLLDEDMRNRLEFGIRFVRPLRCNLLSNGEDAILTYLQVTNRSPLAHSITRIWISRGTETENADSEENTCGERVPVHDFDILAEDRSRIRIYYGHEWGVFDSYLLREHEMVPLPREIYLNRNESREGAVVFRMNPGTVYDADLRLCLEISGKPVLRFKYMEEDEVLRPMGTSF